jgi:hypothetical protein
MTKFDPEHPLSDEWTGRRPASNTKTNTELIVEMIAHAEERDASMQRKGPQRETLTVFLKRCGFAIPSSQLSEDGCQVGEFRINFNIDGLFVQSGTFSYQTFYSLKSLEWVKSLTEDELSYGREILGRAFKKVMQQQEDHRLNPPIQIVHEARIDALTAQLCTLSASGYSVVTHTTSLVEGDMLWHTVILKREA